MFAVNESGQLIIDETDDSDPVFVERRDSADYVTNESSSPAYGVISAAKEAWGYEQVTLEADEHNFTLPALGDREAKEFAENLNVRFPDIPIDPDVNFRRAYWRSWQGNTAKTVAVNEQGQLITFTESGATKVIQMNNGAVAIVTSDASVIASEYSDVTTAWGSENATGKSAYCEFALAPSGDMNGVMYVVAGDDYSTFIPALTNYA